MSDTSAPSAARPDAAAGAPAPAADRPSPPDLTAASFRSATSFLELMRSSSRFCARLLDCEVARIWISRRDGKKLVARDFVDGGTPVVHRASGGRGLAGWVIERGRSLRLAAGESAPGLDARLPGFRAALVVPLVRRGRIIAAIECLDPRGRPAFSQDDQDRLEVAGEHLALALDNALLVEETERRALEKDALFETAKALAAPLEVEEVIETMLRALRDVVEYDAAAVYLLERSTQSLELVADVGYPDGSGSDEAFGLNLGDGIIGWVVKNGEPVIVPDVSRDPRYFAARPATRSELAAPLIVGGRTIGVFNLESDREDAYHDGHLDLVRAIASQAAVALHRARLTRELLERRRLEKELAIAREIQASFLPQRPPEVPGFDIAGTARAHAQVGGDYYDFIRVSDTRIGLAIADVSGKGIPAALIMAGFRMSLLAEIRNEYAIRAVMRKVNDLLYESTDRNKFVTAFYALLDIKHRVLTFSNAGHNPPILYRGRDNAFEALSEGGVALGVVSGTTYEDRPLALRTGDVMVLYTDGITEAESEGGEQFGTRRLEELIARHAGSPAAEVIERVVQAVLDFTGDKGLNDDLAMIVVRVLPPVAEAPATA